MNFQGYVRHISAHNRSEISTIIMSKHNQEMLVSIGQDGLVNLISHDLKIQKSICLNTEYLTSLINYQDGYLIGTDGGYLHKISKQFEDQGKYKIDNDCISAIVETDKHLITVSFDGNVAFLSKQNFQKIKQLKFDVVFQKATLFDNKLYVSGNPSFQINLQTYEYKQLPRSDQTLIFQDQVYQYSDQKGFGSLWQKQQNCLPCQFAMAVQKYIMIVYDQQIGFISDPNEFQEGQYKFYKVEKLPIGDIVKAGVYYNGNIYLGLENGQIFQLKIKIDFNHKQLK